MCIRDSAEDRLLDLLLPPSPAQPAAPASSASRPTVVAVTPSGVRAMHLDLPAQPQNGQTGQAPGGQTIDAIAASADGASKQQTLSLIHICSQYNGKARFDTWLFTCLLYTSRCV